MNDTTVSSAVADSPLTDADSSASDSVLQTVADARGISPVDIREPLYSAVDAEALDALVDSVRHASAATIEFTYCGFDVTVSGDGSVSLDDAETRA